MIAIPHGCLLVLSPQLLHRYADRSPTYRCDDAYWQPCYVAVSGVETPVVFRVVVRGDAIPAKKIKFEKEGVFPI